MAPRQNTGLGYLFSHLDKEKEKKKTRLPIMSDPPEYDFLYKSMLVKMQKEKQQKKI